jgi:CHAT domain
MHRTRRHQVDDEQVTKETDSPGACPGRVGGGEDISGLQRALHLAGARNVLPSLWKVDDQATDALGALFNDRLWRQGEPPLEAQLALNRNPELSRAHGTPDFDKLVQRPEPEPAANGSSALHCARVRQWAAVVLSGYGR